MARGIIPFLSPQTRTTATSAVIATSISTVYPIKLRNGVVSFFFRHTSSRFFCKCSQSLNSQLPLEYTENFSRRMEMASLKPHHRIAMGVSGGADSMALCALMTNWKTCANGDCLDSSGFVDGLLAIIVDHGLRSESKEEAKTVSRWVSDMGIRCEIVHCDWPDGRPKVGHLEEVARDMRYKIFQDVCFQNQIGVLLTAHHADDQAELFVLRLSRNSGVLGLAGMAFTSQLFPKFPCVIGEISDNQGILLVRPFMEFTKEDLYKICNTSNLNWVEDPSNRSSLFARNRIRMALQDTQTCEFRSELQRLIAICRRTRLYVDYICQVLLDQAVTIMPHGYAVIDLGSLNPSKREDICLSRFLALVLQFISQRHRPVRGSASRLLLDYIRTFPCKTSLTAAGCYLCAAPGTKGTKVLVCCSVQSVLPAKTELYSTYPGQEQKQCSSYDVEQIVIDQKYLLKQSTPDASQIHFLDPVFSSSVLAEARRLNILSESTYESILQLQMKETQLFKSKSEAISRSEPKNEVEMVATKEPFRPGQSCYFMSRFFLTWMSHDEMDSCYSSLEDGDQTRDQNCSLCMAGDVVAYVRHMMDEDWLFLAKLANAQDSRNFKQQKFIVNNGMGQVLDKTSLYSNHARSSAQQALRNLKSIPVAARRGLPVIISTEGFLLSIPSIGFNHSPSLIISAQFKPRVPLDGGHNSFI
ncbi:probable tRNA(Ile)-lysidine synthase [Chenopodium quinoa]|uniref:probable tRNA(Ile)-lysidine synthase n=1 Tax=Chenopodium quinoa TaxID=63459 RepID=UPI000B772440|nr:probable tRNA(Ile)-lysidine synthase [Chenopodium quinoa]